MAAESPTHIFADALTVQEARDRFLAENNFKLADYSAPTYTVKLLGIPLKFPNTRAHQWATPLHDLHHVLTGYRTDWIGEAEIGAWELRAGCKTLDVYLLDLGGVVIGMFLSPARIWRAFRGAKGARTLYRDAELCESVWQMTVGDARARLGIPAGGVKGRCQLPA